MGSDLQCSWIAFLAVVNVFDVLILSGALFHTLAASHVKLFFAFVDLPTSVRCPQVRLLVVMAFSCLSLVFILIGYCGSLEAFHISVSLICAAI
jgi:hypothetical protein